jgi:transposase
VEKKIDLRKPYDLLLSMPGVGRDLALTIMMEDGPVDRSIDVHNYVSYCRKVPAARFSNDRKKETNNRKNGNTHLSWAFAEVGELARRFDSEARAYYNRKRRTNAPIAHSARK